MTTQTAEARAAAAYFAGTTFQDLLSADLEALSRTELRAYMVEALGRSMDPATPRRVRPRLTQRFAAVDTLIDEGVFCPWCDHLVAWHAIRCPHCNGEVYPF